MSIDTLLASDGRQFRPLVEIDIGQLNTQWVNIGAGIWYVNALNVYDFVDSSLLDGFTAQGFGQIGSVRSDGLPLTYVGTLAEVTTIPGSFYYDAANRGLYILLTDYTEPALHTIIIGVTNGYSWSDFIPIGANTDYDGRLATDPSISAKRDPLFFGRLQFSGVGVSLINSDSGLDTFGESNDLYGNEGRVLFGYDSLTYADYQRLFTGYVERVSIGEQSVSVGLTDGRKKLTKPITYTCTDLNALSAIEEILLDAYGYPYNSTLFDTTAWETARSNVENVTINMQEPDAVINVIEDICASVFGLFAVDANGKFTFKVTDTTAGQVAFIEATDIMNTIELEYDPSEVISSVRVGYARDWTNTNDVSAYTYYTDTSQEATVFNTYKTYNQRTFKTMLPDLSAATAFGTRVLAQSTTVKPRTTIRVPMSFYAVEIGDMVRVELDREATTMLGEKACEVIGKGFVLGAPAIEFELRVIEDAQAIRQTEDSMIRITEDGALRIVS